MTPDERALCRLIGPLMTDDERLDEALYICCFLLGVPPRDPWWHCGDEIYTCHLGIQYNGRN